MQTTCHKTGCFYLCCFKLFLLKPVINLAFAPSGHTCSQIRRFWEITSTDHLPEGRLCDIQQTFTCRLMREPSSTTLTINIVFCRTFRVVYEVFYSIAFFNHIFVPIQSALVADADTVEI